MRNPFMYQAYQMYADLTRPMQLFARFAAPLVDKLPCDGALYKRLMGGALDVTQLLRLTHSRPPFNIPVVRINGCEVAIEEEFVAHTEFCSLLHFKKQEPRTGEARVLVVAPMSGHFATLLRER